MYLRSATVVLFGFLVLPGGAAADNSDLYQAASNFVNFFWQTWSMDNSDAMPFVNSVVGGSIDFYGKPVSHDAFMKIEGAFVKRWPIRIYTIEPGSLSVNCIDQTSTCYASGIVEWDDSSVARDARSKGVANFDFELQDRPENGQNQFTLVSESGSVISRAVGTLASFSNQVTASTPPVQSQTAPIQDFSNSQGQADNEPVAAVPSYQSSYSDPQTAANSSSSMVGRVASIIGMSISMIFLVMAFLYFVPTAVALARNSSLKWIVFLLNLLLGWTILGWFCALLIGLFSSSGEYNEIQKATLAQIRAGNRPNRDPQM